MFLNNLTLTSFRNFTETLINFERLNILIGSNAQGKSNILESIYFLSTGKSYRVSHDFQLIKKGEAYARVEGEIGGSENSKLEIFLQENEARKQLKVNGLPKRLSDYLGNLVVVFFSPEDINLVTGSPSLRRFHLDLTLASVDREYKKAISAYQQTLVSRNRVLKRIKEGVGKKDELDFWNLELVTYGILISSRREKFFNFLSDSFQKGKFMDKVSIRYLPNMISAERLKEYYLKEVASVSTLIGPHRDDFTFILDGQSLAFFGSRGQMRTAILDLKLQELNFISEVLNLTPVLLLDDVFSELDQKHRDYVASVVGKQQTILSVIDESQIPDNLKRAKKIKVEKGSIKQLFF